MGGDVGLESGRGGGGLAGFLGGSGEEGRVGWKGKKGWVDVRNYIGAGEGEGEMFGRIEVPFAI